MFGLFKKNDKNNSSEPVSPEGSKIKKPISPNVQGRLRHALELIAYVLENDESKKNHIITFVATANDEKGENGVDHMDVAFVRGSDTSLGDMLMQVGMKDETFAKAMIVVSQAIQYHQPHLKEFREKIDSQVQKGINSGEISKNPKKNKERRGLNFEDFGKNMKGLNIDDLSKASDEEIDNLIDDLLTGSLENDEDDD